MSQFDTLRNNIEFIRSEIEKKNSDSPYVSTIRHPMNVITDYDVFPYQRWYKGAPHMDTAVHDMREAGWRIRNDACYQPTYNAPKQPSVAKDFFFSSGCSTNLVHNPPHPQTTMKTANPEYINDCNSKYM